MIQRPLAGNTRYVAIYNGYGSTGGLKLLTAMFVLK